MSKLKFVMPNSLIVTMPVIADIKNMEITQSNINSDVYSNEPDELKTEQLPVVDTDFKRHTQIFRQIKLSN